MPQGFQYSCGMTVFIYSLHDPRNGNMRYIGKCLCINKRLTQHLCEKGASHKHHWLRQLREVGMRPEIRVLETIENSDDREWQERERWWIRFSLEQGHPLTNLCSGGQGPSDINKGRKHTEATRMARSKALTGRVVSEETRRKISESNKTAKAAYFAIHIPKCRMPKVPKERKPISEETRQKMRLSKLGKKQSPEAIEAAHAPLRGLKRSEETRRKMSAAKRAGWAARKALQSINA